MRIIIAITKTARESVIIFCSFTRQKRNGIIKIKTARTLSLRIIIQCVAGVNSGVACIYYYAHSGEGGEGKRGEQRRTRRVCTDGGDGVQTRAAAAAGGGKDKNI